MYEYFAELLMNITRDVVSPAMRAAAEHVCGPKAENINADTRDLMGLFVILRQLLVEVGNMRSYLMDERNMVLTVYAVSNNRFYPQ